MCSPKTFHDGWKHLRTKLLELFDCDGEPEVRAEEQSDNDSDNSSDDCEYEDLENEDNSLYSHYQPTTSSNLDPVSQYKSTPLKKYSPVLLS